VEPPVKLVGVMEHGHFETVFVPTLDEPMRAIAVNVVAESVHAKTALAGQHAPLEFLVVRNASVDKLRGRTDVRGAHRRLGAADPDCCVAAGAHVDRSLVELARS
jgi:hypothetical protein